jgi:hypothetical protein
MEIAYLTNSGPFVGLIKSLLVPKSITHDVAVATRMLGFKTAVDDTGRVLTRVHPPHPHLSLGPVTTDHDLSPQCSISVHKITHAVNP